MHKVELHVLAVSVSISVGLLVCVLMASGYAGSGDQTLYRLPHMAGTPGDSHMVSLEINTAHDIGGFYAVFVSEAGMLSATGISYSGTRSEGVPVWAGWVVNRTPSVLAAIVVYNPPSYVPAGSGPVANMILTSSPSIPKGALLPLLFHDHQPATPGGMGNEMCDPTGINCYFPDFNHGSILFGLDTILSSPALGDVDLDGVPFESGDLMLMHQQLREGVGDYLDEHMQTAASDVNFNQLPWTIADLLTVKAVYEGYMSPPESGTALGIVHLAMDSVWFQGFSGSPTDTVQIAVYISNGIAAGAVSFMLNYSTDELQFISHSMDGSRLPSSWDLVKATETETGLMFYAMPDQSGDPSGFPLPPGDGLLTTLEFVVLNPVSTSPELHFARLQCMGQANGYAVHGWGLWKFASLQQIDSEISFDFIFGDADASGSIDIDDVVYLISHLFSGGPEPNPYIAGDFDRNQVLDVNDAIALIDYIFQQ